jgi:hypothetical protein
MMIRPSAVFAEGVGVGVALDVAEDDVVVAELSPARSPSEEVVIAVYPNVFEFVPDGRAFGSTGPDTQMPFEQRRFGNGLGASNVICSFDVALAVLQATSLTPI